MGEVTENVVVHTNHDYVEDLETLLKESEEKCQREYFARLNAELEANRYKTAFQELVKALATVHKQ